MDLAAYAQEHKMTAVVMTPTNFYYVTGLRGPGIIVQNTKRTILISPLNKQTHDSLPLTKENLEAALKGTRKIGLELNSITYNKYKELKKAQVQDISPTIEQARSIKTQTEVRYIKKACRITDEILAEITPKIKRQKTDSDIQALIMHAIYQRGLEPSFTPIVASGRYAGIPHHVPNRNPLQKGFLIIDFGVKYKGYCSDLTRTFYIGRPTAHEKALYEDLRAIQEQAIRMLTTHPIDEIDAFTRKTNYPHSLGHGIGLDIHESPFLRKGQKIRPGMTLAIEPGHYTKKYGIRIEDDVHIKTKPEILTKSPKKLIIL
ncbi:MAG: M24 family metallopeptidase [Nanobdellota archaeon]